MIPKLDDFLECSASWLCEHRGVRYRLNWHGKSEYNERGTWCYYLIVSSEEFTPEDWKRLRLKEERYEYTGGWRQGWGYEDWSEFELEPHCGWTWGKLEKYLGRDGKEQEVVEVGCDYSHLWDRENNYPDTRSSAESDAKRSIDLLCKAFPNKLERCQYSGMYADKREFYVAVNGNLVHTSQLDKLSPDWTGWFPAPPTEVT